MVETPFSRVLLCLGVLAQKKWKNYRGKIQDPARKFAKNRQSSFICNVFLKIYKLFTIEAAFMTFIWCLFDTNQQMK